MPNTSCWVLLRVYKIVRMFLKTEKGGKTEFSETEDRIEKYTDFTFKFLSKLSFEFIRYLLDIRCGKEMLCLCM